MNLVSRILGGLGKRARVNCKIGQNTITFWNESIVITARLIEGITPDYTWFHRQLAQLCPNPVEGGALAASDRRGS